MPADDDGTTDQAARARLEAIAFGGTAAPEDAAAARRALAELGTALPASEQTLQASGQPAGSETTVGLEGRRGSARTPAEPRTGTTHTGVHDAATGLQAGTVPDRTPSPAPDRASAAPSTAVPPAGWRRRLGRLRDRRIALGAMLVATAVVAFGVGVGVGSIGDQDQRAAAASASAAADGSITLGQYLAQRQTFADQLPGSIIAPVRLHSTRLVFTNRSLSGDDSQTPWDVYAAIGNDDDVVCLIATADGRTSSQSCVARREALTGTVVLVAQSASGILAVRVSAGVVTGRVAPNP